MQKNRPNLISAAIALAFFSFGCGNDTAGSFDSVLSSVPDRSTTPGLPTNNATPNPNDAPRSVVSRDELELVASDIGGYDVDRDGDRILATNPSFYFGIQATENHAYLIDRTAGSTIEIARPLQGKVTGYCEFPRISDDGNYGCFISTADNLVPNDTNYDASSGGNRSGVDVFFAEFSNLAQVTLSRALAPDGGQFSTYFIQTSMSEAGDIYFSTLDFGGGSSFYRLPRLSGVSNALPLSPDFYLSGVSGDGMLLSLSHTDPAFFPNYGLGFGPNIDDWGALGFSYAVSPDASNGQLLTTKYYARGLNSTLYGLQPNRDEEQEKRFTSDGRYYLCLELRPIVGLGDGSRDAPGYTAEVVRCDLRTQRKVIVSTNAGGEPANDWCHSASFSADGRYVTFVSEAQNLGSVGTGTFEPNHLQWNIYVKDTVTGSVGAVDLDRGLPLLPSRYAGLAKLSGDGRQLFFLCRNVAALPSPLRNGKLQLVTVANPLYTEPAQLPLAQDGNGTFIEFEGNRNPVLYR